MTPSIPPIAVPPAATPASIAAVSRTSATHVAAGLGSPVQALRSITAIRAPAPAHITAVARPMPEAPPATRIPRPSSVPITLSPRYVLRPCPILHSFRLPSFSMAWTWRMSGHAPAIDRHRYSGHERGGVAGQEQHGLGHLVRLAETPQRVARTERDFACRTCSGIAGRGEGCFQHRRLDRAGANAVH